MALDQVDIDQYEVDEKGELQPLNDTEMSFLDHLEELRWHIIRSLIAVIITSIIVFLAKSFVFDTLILGPKQNDFFSYRIVCDLSNAMGFGNTLCFEPVKFDVISIDMGELFLTHIQVSIVLGIIMAFPYILWELWRFIKPGLHTHEQNSIQGVVWVCSLLFFTGVLFGYYVVSPFAINFLAGYQIGDVVAQVRLSSMVNYMVMFTAPAGLVFELPIIVYFLSSMGLLTPEFMRTYRRHAIIVILTVAAIITPPDVMTQFLIGIPLYILYELSIGVASRQAKKYQASLDKE